MNPIQWKMSQWMMFSARGGFWSDHTINIDYRKVSLGTNLCTHFIKSALDELNRWVQFKTFSCWGNVWLESSDFISFLLFKHIQGISVCSPSGHPRLGWVCFFIRFGEMCLHQSLSNGCSAVNGCRQNESPNSW